MLPPFPGHTPPLFFESGYFLILLPPPPQRVGGQMEYWCTRYIEIFLHHFNQSQTIGTVHYRSWNFKFTHFLHPLGKNSSIPKASHKQKIKSCKGQTLSSVVCFHPPPQLRPGFFRPREGGRWQFPRTLASGRGAGSPGRHGLSHQEPTLQLP